MAKQTCDQRHASKFACWRNMNAASVERQIMATVICLISCECVCAECRAHSAGGAAGLQVSTATARVAAANSASPEAPSVLHCLIPQQAPQLCSHSCGSRRLQNTLQAKEARLVLIVASQLASNNAKSRSRQFSLHQTTLRSARLWCCRRPVSRCSTFRSA